MRNPFFSSSLLHEPIRCLGLGNSIFSVLSASCFTNYRSYFGTTLRDGQRVFYLSGFSGPQRWSPPTEIVKMSRSHLEDSKRSGPQNIEAFCGTNESPSPGTT